MVKKFNLGKRFFELPGDLKVARTIGIARGNFLTLFGIPILQVGLRDGTGAFFIGNPVDNSQRRFREDR